MSRNKFNHIFETFISSYRRRYQIYSIIRINKFGVHRPCRCRQFRECCTPHDGGKMKILSRAEEGYMSDYPRIVAAFDIAVQGYLSEIRDWEYENQADYYDYESLKEFPF